MVVGEEVSLSFRKGREGRGLRKVVDFLESYFSYGSTDLKIRRSHSGSQSNYPCGTLLLLVYKALKKVDGRRSCRDFVRGGPDRWSVEEKRRKW